MQGTAKVGSDRIVLVTSPGGEHHELLAKNILVGTGSRPFHPDNIPFEDPDARDSVAAVIDAQSPSHRLHHNQDEFDVHVDKHLQKHLDELHQRFLRRRPLGKRSVAFQRA